MNIASKISSYRYTSPPRLLSHRYYITDGFYAIATNLDDTPEQIIQINHRRWEIEECFRIMKHEFSARPVYVRKDMRITAHFTVCFLALVLFRRLEKLL